MLENTHASHIRYPAYVS